MARASASRKVGGDCGWNNKDVAKSHDVGMRHRIRWIASNYKQKLPSTDFRDGSFDGLFRLGDGAVFEPGELFGGQLDLYRLEIVLKLLYGSRSDEAKDVDRLVERPSEGELGF